MKKSTLVTALVMLVLIPGTLWLGSRLPGRWYYMTSTVMVFETMAPFFVLFERRRPQARELVTIAVLCALAAVSRVAFAFFPGFKPVTGIAMIAGIAFGPQAGFLTGAISALASNFFYSQGPWTPWQMMAYGMAGFLGGILFSRRAVSPHPAVMAAAGFFTILLATGPLLDCCTVFTTLTELNWEGVGLVLVRGIPANLTHSVSCAVTMLVLGRPMLEKLDRLKRKYGMMELR